MDIVERLRNNCSCNIDSTPCGAEEQCRNDYEAADEIERLREALQKVLSVQPIRGDEGSLDIVSLAKALLEIDSIARAALKEKE